MLKLSFEVEGVKQVNLWLDQAAYRVRHLQPVWEDIADRFVEYQKEVFGNQGAVGAKANRGSWGPWASLNPDYLEWKVTHGFSPMILIRTGDLLKSLTSRSDSNFLFHPRDLSMTIGTRVPYAKYHQTGATWTRGGRTIRLPKREPIRVNKTQSREWVKLIQLFLVESGQARRTETRSRVMARRG